MSSTPASGSWTRFFLVLSLLLNLILAVGLVLSIAGPNDPEESRLTERHHSGDASASDKIALIKISGILADYSTGYVLKQVEQAAKDRSVRGVVVRVESPGGTITASDELHRSLVELRDNTHTRFTGTGPKPLIASMGPIAASGGYYVSMPAGKVLAEPTTITGSIGVFVALPNVSELANKNGVKVELVKAGSIKAGGSPFQPLTAEERQPWQDMVDHAYDRFLDVVAAGRPKLEKHRLVQEQILFPPTPRPLRGDDAKARNDPGVPARFHRYRADGGTFTPPQALQLGLIDEIGGLNRAIQLIAEEVGISRYRVIAYEKPKTLAEQLLGIQLQQQSSPLEGPALQNLLTPRLWYLSPSYELAGALDPSQVR